MPSKQSKRRGRLLGWKYSGNIILHQPALKSREKVFNIYDIFSVSRLMGSTTATMGHMSNMSSLGTCSVSESKPLQFPLTQRRKRRVLFTQAQVSGVGDSCTLFPVGNQNHTILRVAMGCMNG